MNWVEGTKHTISVPNSLDDNGKEYIFDSWNDGNTSLIRTVIASNNNSYVVNYKQKGNPIWFYIPGIAIGICILYILLFKVVGINRFLSPKQVRERADNSRTRNNSTCTH